MKILYIILSIMVGISSPAWSVYLVWTFFTDMNAFVSALIIIVIIFIALGFMKRAS